MINVIAPPGCYGTYIARCLHHYTSMSNDYCLDFDQNGSSHAFRKIDSNIKKTSLLHWDSVQEIDGNTTIIITGDVDHYLDYYDNQFYKQSQGDLIEYLVITLGLDTIQQRLAQGWGYTDCFDIRVPSWIIREYCSFWITDSWAHGYNNRRYLSAPHTYSFCCEELWSTDIWSLMTRLAAILGQKMHAPEQIVRTNHAAFLNCQYHHGIQLRCEQFVYDTIHKVNSQSPCVSIFDEAYVQYALRKQGYEIQCYNLDQFPTSSNQLAKIIYETSNNHNQR